MTIQLQSKHIRSMRAKLIFNPSAGAARPSPVEIVDVIEAMQDWKLTPGAYLVELGCDLAKGGRGSARNWDAHVRSMRRRWHHLRSGGRLPWPEGTPPWGLSPPARRIISPSAWAFRRISRQPSLSYARANASKWTWAMVDFGETKQVILGSLLGGAVFGPVPGGR